MDTGGRAYWAHKLSDLPATIEKLSRDFRNQYVLGYAPEEGSHDGKYRSIRVEIIETIKRMPLNVFWRQGPAVNERASEPSGVSGVPRNRPPPNLFQALPRTRRRPSVPGRPSRRRRIPPPQPPDGIRPTLSSRDCGRIARSPTTNARHCRS